MDPLPISGVNKLIYLEPIVVLPPMFLGYYYQLYKDGFSSNNNWYQISTIVLKNTDHHCISIIDDYKKYEALLTTEYKSL